MVKTYIVLYWFLSTSPYYEKQIILKGIRQCSDNELIN